MIVMPVNDGNTLNQQILNWMTWVKKNKLMDIYYPISSLPSNLYESINFMIDYYERIYNRVAAVFGRIESDGTEPALDDLNRLKRVRHYIQTNKTLQMQYNAELYEQFDMDEMQ